MNKKLLYYYYLRSNFIKLKSHINNKRNYIYDYSKEKNDLIFDSYKNKIINKMLEISELKRRLSRRVRTKRRSYKRRIVKKFYIRELARKVRNEFFVIFPHLIYFHRREKSWRSIKSKVKKRFKDYPKHKRYLFFRRRKLLRNVRYLNIGNYPTYRQAVDLRIKINSMYFWLVNTTKRQALIVTKLNKLKKIKNNVKNYSNIKRKFFKKRLLFLKKKVRIYKYFLKQKKLYFFKLIIFYFNFYKRLMFLLGLLHKSELFLKFFFYKYVYIFVYLFKKAIVNKLTKEGLTLSFKEFKPLRKKKFKLRKRVKKKLLFLYKISKYTKKIYKLKVRMVNSNFFITLTDYKDKVIISRSTGQVSGNRKKKIKLSPYLVTRMMFGILRKLKKLRVKYLFFFVNTKINRHINNVMKILKNIRYTKILKFFFSKPIAHHFGTRKPKLRRL